MPRGGGCDACRRCRLHREQYWAAATAIRDSKHHAVKSSQLMGTLGLCYKGREALGAMLRAGLLAYRPYSNWAADIPREAFGEGRGPLVTAATPMHLYHMKQFADF